MIDKNAYYYRELYGLNNWIEGLKKELLDMKEVEVYALQPLGVGFIELSTSSKTEIEGLNKECISRLIAFCEKQKIEKHLLGPLTIF